MAIEAYIVAYDIKSNGGGSNLPFEKELGAAKETSVGIYEGESGGLATAKSGIVDQVATCKLVEVLSNSATEAIAVVRSKYPEASSGAVRAVVKPNTNFKIAI